MKNKQSGIVGKFSRIPLRSEYKHLNIHTSTQMAKGKVLVKVEVHAQVVYKHNAQRTRTTTTAATAHCMDFEPRTCFTKICMPHQATLSPLSISVQMPRALRGAVLLLCKVLQCAFGCCFCWFFLLPHRTYVWPLLLLLSNNSALPHKRGVSWRRPHIGIKRIAVCADATRPTRCK